ncbi:MAG: PAAR domain-containing protein [Polyangiales bacterium]
MPEAARVGDSHECHQVDGNHPHRGGEVMGPASRTVMTGHQPQARAGDRCHCDGPPDFITTGSASVYVDGMPAARKGDRTMHMPMGVIAAGDGSVRIGGPSEGTRLGIGDAGTALCEQAAAGRASGSTKQSYGNCGLESARQLINLYRDEPVSEAALLRDAIDHGEASNERNERKRGGSTPVQRRRLLARYGVETFNVPNTMTAVAQAVAEGRGVITSHVSGILWGTTDTGGHAVLVTGIEFDAEGRIASVLINDTGKGRCGHIVSGDRFGRSLVRGLTAGVTRDVLR